MMSSELDLICWKNSLGLSCQTCRASGVRTNQYSRFNSSHSSIVIWSRTMRAFSRAWQIEEMMRVRIFHLEHQKFRDVLRGGLLVEREKLLLVAGGLHDGQPVFGQALLIQIAQVQQQLQIHVHDARDVFGALDVTRHPIQTVGNAA